MGRDVPEFEEVIRLLHVRLLFFQNGFMSTMNKRLPHPILSTAKMQRSWSSVVSGKKDKPKAPRKPRKVYRSPAEAAIRIQSVFRGYRVRRDEREEFENWLRAECNDAGCDAHDRIGCAECAFNASGVCPSSKEEGHWEGHFYTGGRWVYD